MKTKKTKGLSKKDKKEILDLLETLANANIRLVISFEPKKRGVYISDAF